MEGAVKVPQLIHLVRGEQNRPMERHLERMGRRHVALITHDGRACCPCGGCSYRLEGERFEMTTCELYPAVTCEHWEKVWNEAGRVSKGEA